VYSEDNAAARASLFNGVYTRYRDAISDIGINIHTSPDNETSSQGCLNIPISYFTQFLTALTTDTTQPTYLYTLVDASKIKGMTE
jgi:hypothetical protein